MKKYDENDITETNLLYQIAIVFIVLSIIAIITSSYALITLPLFSILVCAIIIINYAHKNKRNIIEGVKELWRSW